MVTCLDFIRSNTNAPYGYQHHNSNIQGDQSNANPTIYHFQAIQQTVACKCASSRRAQECIPQTLLCFYKNSIPSARRGSDLRQLQLLDREYSVNMDDDSMHFGSPTAASPNSNSILAQPPLQEENLGLDAMGGTSLSDFLLYRPI